MFFVTQQLEDETFSSYFVCECR